ncbi:MAG: ADP-ribosylglycohydrolase family protein [Aureliella sp.]
MQTAYQSILGSMLGHLFADAIGSTFEGVPAEHLRDQFSGPNDVFQTSMSKERFRYTDDGQMMLALAEYLTVNDTIEPNTLMQQFVEAFEPRRGYGRGARTLIEAYRDQSGNKSDYESLVEHLFPGGSLGNGGAMRCSPVGLKYVGDLDRISTEAKQSSWPTHRHEIGVEGARLIALATSFAQTAETITPEFLSKTLLPHCNTAEFQNRIKRLAEITNADAVSEFGNGIEAHQSVVTALACFSLFPNDFQAAVSLAFWQGGDTDTIGAMTGALVGARLGPVAVAGLPQNKLENGLDFLNYVEDLAHRLEASVV